MFVLKGNTNSDVLSQQYSLPIQIKSFSVVNKSGGAVAINVYLITGSDEILITPLNLNLASGALYGDNRVVCVLATEQVKLTTTGSVDYCFTLDNI